MDKKYFQELLDKYESNQLNDHEKKILDNWYNSFEHTQNVAPLQHKATKEKLYRSLKYHINQHITGSSSKVKKLFWPYAVAASLLLAVPAIFILRSQNTGVTSGNNADKTYMVVTKPGELKKVMLPDGSVVWINSCSRIKFNETTFLKKRDIFLSEGEAFFKVVKNPKSPFKVHTATITTQVFGTSFNVKVYGKLPYAAVHVKTGKVGVTDKAGASIMLTANQFTIYDKQLKLLKRGSAGMFDADSWVDGMINIKDASFSELAMILYNHYKVRIRSTDPKILGYSYTLIIAKNSSLDYTLKLLCAIHHNHYRRTKNEVNIYP